jgi:hypothetical protein
MKREELEVSGEEATKYRKEPSPCPVCGKVRNVTHNWLAGSISPPISAALLVGVLGQDV